MLVEEGLDGHALALHGLAQVAHVELLEVRLYGEALPEVVGLLARPLCLLARLERLLARQLDFAFVSGGGEG